MIMTNGCGTCKHSDIGHSMKYQCLLKNKEVSSGDYCNDFRPKFVTESVKERFTKSDKIEELSIRRDVELARIADALETIAKQMRLK